MTQKEKAELCDKAYDKVAARFGLNVANEIFTGLKESEDERIRKALIQLVNQCDEELLHPDNARQMLAWLEKQGEKLPVGFYYVNSEGKKFYSDTFKYGDVTLHVEKQGEQKPAENKGMDLVEEEMTPFQKKVFCIVDTSIEEEQGLSNICNELLALAIQEIEQKPAWSEEDEKVRKALKEAGYEWSEETHELKKIEQNLAWDEEDEKMIDEIIDYMKPMPIFFESTKGKSGKEYTQKFVKNAINWLKSLKERIGE